MATLFQTRPFPNPPSGAKNKQTMRVKKFVFLQFTTRKRKKIRKPERTSLLFIITITVSWGVGASEHPGLYAMPSLAISRWRHGQNRGTSRHKAGDLAFPCCWRCMQRSRPPLVFVSLFLRGRNRRSQETRALPSCRQGIPPD